MAAANRRQSNAMLYTLLIFVGLFIAATTVAIIYYIQFEDQRTLTTAIMTEKEELATSDEWKSRATKIGTRENRETYLGKMLGYLDKAAAIIMGQPVADTSAEVKIQMITSKVNGALDAIRGKIDLESLDPNTIGIVRVIEKLNVELENITSQATALKGQYADLQSRFDQAISTSREKENDLLTEKDKYQQQVNEIKQRYDELEELMKQTTEQQVQTLVSQLSEMRADFEGTRNDLLRTQAQLQMTESRMGEALDQLRLIEPLPDTNVPAYQSDGRIVLMDSQLGIVHINLGSKDRVYPGLTFAVYDKNMPIPKDGKGKGEIEVFRVDENISAGRILSSDIKNPIIVEDPIANLVWDRDKTNEFVISGQFDLDGDGSYDYEALEKLTTIIKAWGGEVSSKITIETDYLILGSAPNILRKPSLEELEIYPDAMEKYEGSLKEAADYNEIRDKAKTLSIPVFNLERFLYFIGYKTRSGQSGAY